MAPTITLDVTDEQLKALETLGFKPQVETPKPAETQTPIDFQVDPTDYILLEGKSGKDGYPDLWVCKYRLGSSPAVENAGRIVNANTRNTAKEQNGREYIGNINRERALKLNLALDGRTLNLRTGRDFFTLVRSGKAFDGNGKKIGKQELSQIADEIFGVRFSYRAEFFEDYFTGKQDLNKNYVLDNGVLKPQYSRNLTACLLEDRTPGIDLGNWLENSTAQGLPKKSVKSGKLWYWHPRAGRAVRFGAYPDYAFLSCGWYPQDSDARLGVRHVREAHAPKI